MLNVNYNTDQYTTCNTIEEARQFIGGGSALHFTERSLRKLKEEAIGDKHVIHSAAVDAGIASDNKKRMHYNGAIAAKNSIINKIDSLLKAKGLGGQSNTSA